MKKTLSLPLCVDLDGTLILNDVTWMAVEKFLLQYPFKVFHLLGWLLEGRAFLKQHLANNIDLDVSQLPYNKKLIEYLTTHASNLIYLVTAADQKIAEQVAEYLGIFEQVIGSDGVTNLRAQAKADKLISLFGEKQFIYIGNSKDDLYVWKHAAVAIPVNTSYETEEKLKHMKVDILRI